VQQHHAVLAEPDGAVVGGKTDQATQVVVLWVFDGRHKTFSSGVPGEMASVFRCIGEAWPQYSILPESREFFEFRVDGHLLRCSVIIW
jgi:hypothetical protein